MIIAIPFFGDKAKHLPLLERWFEAFNKLGSSHQVVLITDGMLDESFKRFKCGGAIVNLDGWRECIRPGQPFDVKGALVAGYLEQWDYPTLVLDADAFPVKDPLTWLLDSGTAWKAMAMPIDHGAIVHCREHNFSPPFQSVPKTCAGVMFFGSHPGRKTVPELYRQFFKAIVKMDRLPWEPQLQHLVEQYAWSFANHKMGGALLPHTFNWHPGLLGVNPSTVIEHHYGFRKWA